ncbi:NRX4 protein, partial [Pseudoatta argentina]
MELRDRYEIRSISTRGRRINPTRWRNRISLRVKLYGCDYVSDIASFNGFSLIRLDLLREPIETDRHFFIDRVLIKGRIEGVFHNFTGCIENFTGCIENFYLNSMYIICELKETKIINENLRYYKCPEPPIIPVTFLTFIILYHKFKSPGFVKLYLEEDKLKIDIIRSVVGSESNHDFVGCMRIIIDGNYKLPTMVDRCSGDIYFEFKTTIQAVIIYSKGPTDYVKVSIHNGNQVYFQYVIGREPLTVNVQTSYNLGDDKDKIGVYMKPNSMIKYDFASSRRFTISEKIHICEEAFHLGQYHDVRIGRKKSGAILTLQVDNYETKEFEFNIKHSADCGVKPITHPSYIKETRPPSQVNEGKVRAVYNETDATILESVLAVILIALVIMAILIGRYMSRNKDEYLLQEDKSAEIALDPIVNSVTGHQVQKKERVVYLKKLH